MRKKTTEEFIRDAVRVHADTYDYSLVKYQKSNEKVVIICKKHKKELLKRIQEFEKTLTKE